MAQMTTAELEPLLTQLGEKQVRPQFEQVTTLFNLINKATNPKFVNGKGYRINAYLRPDAANGYISEGGSFPAAGKSLHANMYVYPTRYVKPFELSGDFLDQVEDESSLMNGLKDVLKNCTASGQKELEQILYGDGTGLKATVASTSGSTITCATAAASGYGSTKGSRDLIELGLYDVISTAGTNRGTITISAGGNALSTSVITVDAVPGGTTAGDILVNTGGYNKAPRGLAHLINNDSGVIQLLSRSTYPQLKCVAIDQAGAAVTVAVQSKLKRLMKYRSGPDMAKNLTFLIPPSQEDGIERLGHNLRRFGAGDRTFDGSFDKIAHGDSQFIVSIDLDEDRMYALDLSDIQRYEMMPWGYYRKDGLILRMKAGSNSTGSDAYVGAMGVKFNLGVTTFRNHGLIKRNSTTDLATGVGAWS